ncbi:MAG: hypothetical protein M3490_10475 [Chloroflexota bacterium]|nr:hypothetical protein [Chloroflexota bacterium]
MQRNLNTPGRRSRWLCWSTLTVAAFAMTACGPLGDDDSNPTATSETITQPTSAAPNEPGGTPGGFVVQPDGDAATPEMSGSTPAINNPVSPQGTPDEPFTVIVGTPNAPDAAVANGGQAATPMATAAAVFVGSDGTSGATPDPETGSVADPGTPQSGNPPADDSLLVTDGATPAADATTEAVVLTDLEPVTVAGCEPETVPPLEGASLEFITVTDVNFRTGPGADCDTIGTGPIGTNVPVTVLSGPVVREDDDQFEWVQVQILDQTGWVVIDVLEPAQ